MGHYWWWWSIKKDDRHQRKKMCFDQKRSQHWNHVICSHFRKRRTGWQQVQNQVISFGGLLIDLFCLSKISKRCSNQFPINSLLICWVCSSTSPAADHPQHSEMAWQSFTTGDEKCTRECPKGRRTDKRTAALNEYLLSAVMTIASKKKREPIMVHRSPEGERAIKINQSGVLIQAG